MIAWAITALGVSIGATQPRFDLTNPAMVASSLGGISFMMLAGLYLFIFMGLCYYPALVWSSIQTGHFTWHTLWEWNSWSSLSIASLMLLHGFQWVVCRYVVKWSSKRLDYVLMSGAKVE